MSEIGHLAGELNARIRALVGALNLDGRQEGHEYVALNPTRHDTKLGSFKICIGGAKQGTWKDFSSGDAGDALDLVAYIKFGKNKREAIEWSRTWIGDPRPASAEAHARPRNGAFAPSRSAPGDRPVDLVDEANKFLRVNALWEECRPIKPGDMVDQYLKGRAIDLSKLGAVPKSLRFHSALWHGPSREKLPAMVAAIDGPRGEILAVHRTYLARRGAIVTKAPLGEQAKMVFGRYRGGCIRLWRGGSKEPLQKAPAGEFVGVSEGIEDGLSAALLKPELRIVCAISVSGMINLDLPKGINVTVLAQNDPGDISARDNEDAAARMAIERAVKRWRLEGRTVRVARPPDGVKDWNDQLRSESETKDEVDD